MENRDEALIDHVQSSPSGSASLIDSKIKSSSPSSTTKKPIKLGVVQSSSGSRSCMGNFLRKNRWDQAPQCSDKEESKQLKTGGLSQNQENSANIKSLIQKFEDVTGSSSSPVDLNLIEEGGPSKPASVQTSGRVKLIRTNFMKPRKPISVSRNDNNAGACTHQNEVISKQSVEKIAIATDITEVPEVIPVAASKALQIISSYYDSPTDESSQEGDITLTCEVKTPKDSAYASLECLNDNKNKSNDSVSTLGNELTKFEVDMAINNENKEFVDHVSKKVIFSDSEKSEINTENKGIDKTFIISTDGTQPIEQLSHDFEKMGSYNNLDNKEKHSLSTTIDEFEIDVTTAQLANKNPELPETCQVLSEQENKDEDAFNEAGDVPQILKNPNLKQENNEKIIKTDMSYKTTTQELQNVNVSFIECISTEKQDMLADDENVNKTSCNEPDIIQAQREFRSSELFTEETTPNLKAISDDFEKVQGDTYKVIEKENNPTTATIVEDNIKTASENKVIKRDKSPVTKTHMESDLNVESQIVFENQTEIVNNVKNLCLQEQNIKDSAREDILSNDNPQCFHSSVTTLEGSKISSKKIDDTEDLPVCDNLNILSSHQSDIGQDDLTETNLLRVLSNTSPHAISDIEMSGKSECFSPSRSKETPVINYPESSVNNVNSSQNTPNKDMDTIKSVFVQKESGIVSSFTESKVTYHDVVDATMELMFSDSLDSSKVLQISSEQNIVDNISSEAVISSKEKIPMGELVNTNETLEPLHSKEKTGCLETNDSLLQMLEAESSPSSINITEKKLPQGDLNLFVEEAQGLEVMDNKIFEKSPLSTCDNKPVHLDNTDIVHGESNCKSLSDLKETEIISQFSTSSKGIEFGEGFVVDKSEIRECTGKEDKGVLELSTCISFQKEILDDNVACKDVEMPSIDTVRNEDNIEKAVIKFSCLTFKSDILETNEICTNEASVSLLTDSTQYDKKLEGIEFHIPNTTGKSVVQTTSDMLPNTQAEMIGSQEFNKGEKLALLLDQEININDYEQIDEGKGDILVQNSSSDVLNTCPTPVDVNLEHLENISELESVSIEVKDEHMMYSDKEDIENASELAITMTVLGDGLSPNIKAGAEICQNLEPQIVVSNDEKTSVCHAIEDSTDTSKREILIEELPSMGHNTKNEVSVGLNANVVTESVVVMETAEYEPYMDIEVEPSKNSTVSGIVVDNIESELTVDSTFKHIKMDIEPEINQVGNESSCMGNRVEFIDKFASTVTMKEREKLEPSVVVKVDDCANIVDSETLPTTVKNITACEVLKHADYGAESIHIAEEVHSGQSISDYKLKHKTGREEYNQFVDTEFKQSMKMVCPETIMDPEAVLDLDEDELLRDAESKNIVHQEIVVDSAGHEESVDIKFGLSGNVVHPETVLCKKPSMVAEREDPERIAFRKAILDKEKNEPMLKANVEDAENIVHQETVIETGDNRESGFTKFEESDTMVHPEAEVIEMKPFGDAEFESVEIIVDPEVATDENEPLVNAKMEYFENILPRQIVINSGNDKRSEVIKFEHSDKMAHSEAEIDKIETEPTVNANEDDSEKGDPQVMVGLGENELFGDATIEASQRIVHQKTVLDSVKDEESMDTESGLLDNMAPKIVVDKTLSINAEMEYSERNVLAQAVADKEKNDLMVSSKVETFEKLLHQKTVVYPGKDEKLVDTKFEESDKMVHSETEINQMEMKQSARARIQGCDNVVSEPLSEEDESMIDDNVVKNHQETVINRPKGVQYVDTEFKEYDKIEVDSMIAKPSADGKVEFCEENVDLEVTLGKKEEQVVNTAMQNMYQQSMTCSKEDGRSVESTLDISKDILTSDVVIDKIDNEPHMYANLKNTDNYLPDSENVCFGEDKQIIVAKLQHSQKTLDPETKSSSVENKTSIDAKLDIAENTTVSASEMLPRNESDIIEMNLSCEENIPCDGKKFNSGSNVTDLIPRLDRVEIFSQKEPIEQSKHVLYKVPANKTSLHSIVKSDTVIEDVEVGEIFSDAMESEALKKHSEIRKNEVSQSCNETEVKKTNILEDSFNFPQKNQNINYVELLNRDLREATRFTPPSQIDNKDTIQQSASVSCDDNSEEETIQAINLFLEDTDTNKQTKAVIETTKDDLKNVIKQTETILSEGTKEAVEKHIEEVMEETVPEPSKFSIEIKSANKVTVQSVSKHVQKETKEPIIEIKSVEKSLMSSVEDQKSFDSNQSLPYEKTLETTKQRSSVNIENYADVQPVNINPIVFGQQIIASSNQTSSVVNIEVDIKKNESFKILHEKLTNKTIQEIPQKKTLSVDQIPSKVEEILPTELTVQSKICLQDYLRTADNISQNRSVDERQKAVKTESNNKELDNIQLNMEILPNVAAKNIKPKVSSSNFKSVEPAVEIICEKPCIDSIQTHSVGMSVNVEEHHASQAVKTCAQGVQEEKIVLLPKNSSQTGNEPTRHITKPEKNQEQQPVKSLLKECHENIKKKTTETFIVVDKNTTTTKILAKSPITVYKDTKEKQVDSSENDTNTKINTMENALFIEKKSLVPLAGNFSVPQEITEECSKIMSSKTSCGYSEKLTNKSPLNISIKSLESVENKKNTAPDVSFIGDEGEIIVKTLEGGYVKASRNSISVADEGFVQTITQQAVPAEVSVKLADVNLDNKKQNLISEQTVDCSIEENESSNVKKSQKRIKREHNAPCESDKSNEKLSPKGFEIKEKSIGCAESSSQSSMHQLVTETVAKSKLKTTSVKEVPAPVRVSARQKQRQAAAAAALAAEEKAKTVKSSPESIPKKGTAHDKFAKKSVSPTKEVHVKISAGKSSEVGKQFSLTGQKSQRPTEFKPSLQTSPKKIMKDLGKDKLEPITLKLSKEDNPIIVRASSLSPKKVVSPLSPQMKTLGYTLKIGKDSTTIIPKDPFSPKTRDSSPISSGSKADLSGKVGYLIKDTGLTITPIATAETQEQKLSKITLKLSKAGGHPEIKQEKSETWKAIQKLGEIDIVPVESKLSAEILKRKEKSDHVSPEKKLKLVDITLEPSTSSGMSKLQGLLTQAPLNQSDDSEDVQFIGFGPPSEKVHPTQQISYDIGLIKQESDQQTGPKRRGRPRKITSPDEIVHSVSHTLHPGLTAKDIFAASLQHQTLQQHLQQMQRPMEIVHPQEESSQTMFPVPLFDLAEDTFMDPTPPTIFPDQVQPEMIMRSARGRPIGRSRRPRGSGLIRAIERGGPRGRPRGSRGMKRMLEEIESMSYPDMDEPITLDNIDSEIGPRMSEHSGSQITEKTMALLRKSIEGKKENLEKKVRRSDEGDDRIRDNDLDAKVREMKEKIEAAYQAELKFPGKVTPEKDPKKKTVEKSDLKEIIKKGPPQLIPIHVKVERNNPVGKKVVNNPGSEEEKSTTKLTEEKERKVVNVPACKEESSTRKSTEEKIDSSHMAGKGDLKRKFSEEKSEGTKENTKRKSVEQKIGKLTDENIGKCIEQKRRKSTEVRYRKSTEENIRRSTEEKARISIEEKASQSTEGKTEVKESSENKHPENTEEIEKIKISPETEQCVKRETDCDEIDVDQPVSPEELVDTEQLKTEPEPPPKPVKPKPKSKAEIKRIKREKDRIRREAKKLAALEALKAPPPNPFEEDTRMSASDPNGDGIDDPLGNGIKKNRMEVGDPEGKEFSVDQIAEYQWPLQGGELYMIQEQISTYLGVKSFKRKYPDLKRRPVEMEERTFLCDSGLVSESMCDLGLTAVSSSEVLDIMFQDFQDQYEELRKHMREKQARELINKQKERKKFEQSLSKSDLKEQAIQSSMSWNQALNKSRGETRRCHLDLQTWTIQYPRSRGTKMTRPMGKLGNYPVALIPGQYADYYKRYTAQELRYWPLNTVLYGPLQPNERHSTGGSDGSQSESEDSSSSDDSSDSSSEGEGTCEEEERECKTCGGGKRVGEAIVQCSECGHNIHVSCADLNPAMLVHVRKYSWQCSVCKTCQRCNNAKNESKMLFCDVCDRGYHSYCVGLRRVPSGSWTCQVCAPD